MLSGGLKTITFLNCKYTRGKPERILKTQTKDVVKVSHHAVIDFEETRYHKVPPLECRNSYCCHSGVAGVRGELYAG